MKPVGHIVVIPKTQDYNYWATGEDDIINPFIVHEYIDTEVWGRLNTEWYWDEARDIRQELNDKAS